MNTLSWLIYAAGVAENFHDTRGFAVFFGTLCTISLCVGAYVPIWNWAGRMKDHQRYPSLYPNPPGDNPGRINGMIRAAKMIGFSVIALMAAGVVVPQKETVYAIAASEVGEEVIKSETAGKAMRALNAWLDDQIAKPEKKGA